MTFNKSKRTRALGVTLIETVAALALLGSLVSLSFSSRSNINQQYLQANLKTQAAQIADKQIQLWYNTPQGPPHQATGVITENPSWTFRTSVINNPDLVKLNLAILHLQVFAPVESNPQAGPAITVELVIPAEKSRP